jgi:hypothetical protein
VNWRARRVYYVGTTLGGVLRATWVQGFGLRRSVLTCRGG